MEPIPEGRFNERQGEPATAGAWLRQQRQHRGLHIAALAVMLKVPQAKLEALEADRWQDLPDATFARALATAMCRALKVDAAPVLALMPRSDRSEFDVRPGLNQPFRERSANGAVDAGVLMLLARPVVWGPVLLLLAAAAIYWIPAGWLPERDASVAASAGAASAPPAEFIPAPAASAVVLAEAPPAYASAPLATPEPAAVQTVPAQPPVAAASQAVVTAAAAPAAAGHGLRITAVADSWIEVTDGRGQVLLSRVLREGEQQEFNGAPLKVRVGNVHGTRVEWRGEAVNLAERSSNNVARLEFN